MKITNKLNLPEPFNSLVTKELKPPVENRYSVTELLSSVKEIVLKRRYYEHLTEDVADMIPALFGTALHKLMEDSDNGNTEVKLEYKLEYKIGDITLVGKIDKVTEDTIIDYKTCKVSKITKKNFSDDYHQGMIYAFMRLMIDDVKTKKLKFYNLMKDWSKLHFTNNYPTTPIYVWEYDIQDSDYDYIIKFISDKLKAIKEGFELLPDCNDEERWYTGTKYAVYKNKGDKKASYLADSEEDAQNYINNKLNGIGVIEVRKGEDLKCKHYCICSKFCKGGE